MSESRHCPVLIIGSGAAGYTAAIYAAQAGLKPVLVQGLQPGGQLTITTEVENYPGFADVIQGPWPMEQMAKQAENVVTDLQFDTIVEVKLDQWPFMAIGDSGTTFTADALIIATGAQARWLGLDSEQKLQGADDSACVTCDGIFFRGHDIAVIGGGNSAVEEALYLANLANSETVVHRRDALRAEHFLQERLFAHSKVTIRWNRVVEEIFSDGEPPAVSGLRLRSTVDDTVEEVAVTGAYVAIGHDPATKLFKGLLDMDESDYIPTVPDFTATNILGVFAAGGVKDKVYRQAVTAAGLGCRAALEAERFLSEQLALATAAQ